MLSLFNTISALSFSILYEKKVEKTVEQTYRIYLEQLIKSINSVSSKKNINFNIDKIISYSNYVNQDEFAELSGYAGEGDIKGRILALENLKIDNFIFAVTTNQYDEMQTYQKASPCKISYIFNLDSQENYDNDLLSNLQYAVRDALSRVLNLKGLIPNLLNTHDTEAHDDFEKIIDNIDEKQLFAECEKKDDGKLETNGEYNIDKLEALLDKLKKSKTDTKTLPRTDNKSSLIDKRTGRVEPKGNDTSLILKSLEQMKDKIEQIDVRIREVEKGNPEVKLKKVHLRTPRNLGNFQNENVTPITIATHSNNYQPFQFTKKELKATEAASPS